MKQTFMFLILLLVFTFSSFAQGLSKFEIWGWNGSKEEFANKYKEQTGTDLNHGYCCVAELHKMGYAHAVSEIFIDNIDDFLAGNLNWDLTERLTIIRQVSESKYTIKASDTLWQYSTSKLISSFVSLDSLSLKQYLIPINSLD